MGFSLIEMMVVIGILAILIAALLPMIGGSRDSAMNAKCQNNLRNLAQAVLSWAQARTDNLGHFPAAGLYRSIDVHARSKSYYPHRAWISNKGDAFKLNNSQSDVYLGTVAHFSDADNAERRFAITNGAIWHAVGESYEIYQCPVHARAFQEKKGYKPGWSYMMNQEFGFNRGGGNSSIGFFGSSISGRITVSKVSSGKRNEKAKDDNQTVRNPDKVLLFTEVQGVDIDDVKNNVTLKAVESATGTDAVLEYTKEADAMGFNHKLGRKLGYGGNVAFADGHVETIVMPKGMNRKDLTRYLCQGYDVPHDGRAYTPDEKDK